MTKTTIYCDHCKSELDEMHDCCDYEISLPYEFARVDLCEDCRLKLLDLLEKFFNKELKK